jgi:hypothetical protein
VHFPVDSAAGAVLGGALGNYFVSRCRAAGDYHYQAWKFDGAVYPAERDFYWTDFFDTNGSQIEFSDPNNPDYRVASEVAPEDGKPLSFAKLDHSEILTWLWKKAVGEWKAVRETD